MENSDASQYFVHIRNCNHYSTLGQVIHFDPSPFCKTFGRTFLVSSGGLKKRATIIVALHFTKHRMITVHQCTHANVSSLTISNLKYFDPVSPAEMMRGYLLQRTGSIPSIHEIKYKILRNYSPNTLL